MARPPGERLLLALAGKRFILLTTYRRSGEAVSTPVW
jgi:hypothetical protein